MPSFFKILPTFLLPYLAGILLVQPVLAAELETRFATIIYENQEILHEFNNEVSSGSGLMLFSSRRPTSLNIVDEVKNKLDGIVEKVELVLEMFPANLRFVVVLLPSDRDVQRVYLEKYQKKVDYIAFYMRKTKTMYLSVDDVSLTVLAHEIAHVVVDHYFDISPPTKIHEMLAQYASTHIYD